MPANAASSLTKIQNDADADDIKIGSYPHWPPIEFEGRIERVQVSVVGKDAVVVEKWTKTVRKAISGWIVPPNV
jgi:hypothetical protein